MGNKQNLYEKALKVVFKDNKASISYVQRRLGIGYNKAAELVERMELEGIVSKPMEDGKRIIYLRSNGSEPTSYGGCHTIHRLDVRLKPIVYDAINWPPVSKVAIYGNSGELIAKSRKGERFDLSDNLMRWKSQRRVVLGVSVLSKRWDVWSKEALEAVEDYISYDLSFDGFTVKIRRLKGFELSCSEQALWELKIKVEIGKLL